MGAGGLRLAAVSGSVIRAGVLQQGAAPCSARKTSKADPGSSPLRCFPSSLKRPRLVGRLLSGFAASYWFLLQSYNSHSLTLFLRRVPGSNHSFKRATECSARGKVDPGLPGFLGRGRQAVVQVQYIRQESYVHSTTHTAISGLRTPTSPRRKLSASERRSLPLPRRFVSLYSTCRKG